MVKEAEKMHTELIEQVSLQVAVKPEIDAKKKKRVVITNGE
jgi:hypothetical protein